MLKEISRCLSTEQRKNLIKFIPTLLLGTFLELATLGIMYPFITSIIKPAESSKVISKYFPIGSSFEDYSLELISLVLVIAIVLSLFVRTHVAKRLFGIIYDIGCSISNKIYENQLGQNYDYYLAVSTPEIQVKINNSLQLTQKVISPFLQSISFGFQSVAIMLLILIINPAIAVPSITMIAVMYYFVTRQVKNRLREKSQISYAADHNRQKIVHESVSGIKTIIIENDYSKYRLLYEKNEKSGYNARAEGDSLAVTPKYIIESAIIITTIILANIYIYSGASQAAMIASFGVLGIAAQRIMPSIQIIYHAWASIEGSHSLIKEVVNDLKLKKEDNFSNQANGLLAKNNETPLIQLKNINLSYSDKKILKDVNLIIEAGKCVGIVGKTGSGKSTLLDVILGLRSIDSGEILINGEILNKRNVRRWHEDIAYVPQQIYLRDASAIENIGNKPTEQIEIDRVIKSLEISEFAMDSTDINKKIGDNGARISGGQRQRLGIARAIYLKKPILIFDEATSAIDEETERKILKNIRDSLGNVTIILITHRKSLLDLTDITIEMRNNSIVQSLNYKKMKA